MTTTPLRSASRAAWAPSAGLWGVAAAYRAARAWARTLAASRRPSTYGGSSTYRMAGGGSAASPLAGAAAPDQPRLFHPPGVIRLLTPAEEAALAARPAGHDTHSPAGGARRAPDRAGLHR